MDSTQIIFGFHQAKSSRGFGPFDVILHYHLQFLFGTGSVKLIDIFIVFYLFIFVFKPLTLRFRTCVVFSVLNFDLISYVVCRGCCLQNVGSPYWAERGLNIKKKKKNKDEKQT